MEEGSSEEEAQEHSPMASRSLAALVLITKGQIQISRFLNVFFFASACWHIILVPVPQLVGGGNLNTMKTVTPGDIAEYFSSARLSVAV